MQVNLTCQYIFSIMLTLKLIVVVIHLPSSVCYFPLEMHLSLNSLPHGCC